MNGGEEVVSKQYCNESDNRASLNILYCVGEIRLTDSLSDCITRCLPPPRLSSATHPPAPPTHNVQLIKKYLFAAEGRAEENMKSPVKNS